MYLAATVLPAPDSPLKKKKIKIKMLDFLWIRNKNPDPRKKIDLKKNP
jgi:hypothetical protein